MLHIGQFQSLLIATTIAGCLAAPVAAWQPVGDRIMSRWASEVDPAAPWPEYPRPQMAREAWLNLNGLWDYAIAPRDESQPAAWEGQILVPFAIESALSGVGKAVGEDKRLWYRRGFEISPSWTGKRVLLNFEAVDWEMELWVNGTSVGSHRGGYDPFSFDITDALRKDGAQEVVLAVWDPTDKGYQPRGKQVSEPEGIWYTAVTGIWQTVWLEPVDETHIERMEMTPDIDAQALEVTAHLQAAGASDTLKVIVRDKGGIVGEEQGKASDALRVAIAQPKLWSPDAPHLYDVEVTVLRDGKPLDTITSYAGMRSIALQKDDKGINRLFLNNEPLFHLGPLDQGWWPDGLYTAPTDNALRYDVAITRKLGFNMARKHVKVEPRRWYYHCDQLGLMVWQDMPSGDRYIKPNEEDIVRTSESEANYYREWGAIIDTLYNHPSIVMWVPFNEGWGQFDTNAVTAWTKAKDPTRLVNQASGWSDRAGGDVYDKHSYPGPAMFPIEESRASVLGEFGGLGWPVGGHLWWDKRNWGYRTYQSQQELRTNYTSLILNLRPLIAEGLAAAVYTQTTDVEGEVNGLMTYDRDQVKAGEDWLAKINATVYGPPPRVTPLVPTSEAEGVSWRYTTEGPGNNWEQPGFDDSAWTTGPGVFGTEGTPGAVIRSAWDSRHIWLRRTFDLSGSPSRQMMLLVHHDEDAEIFINGVQAAKVSGYTTGYVPVAIEAAALEALKPGENLLAAHCRQTDGGQCIDVGLVLYEEP